MDIFFGSPLASLPIGIAGAVVVEEADINLIMNKNQQQQTN